MRFTLAPEHQTREPEIRLGRPPGVTAATLELAQRCANLRKAGLIEEAIAQKVGKTRQRVNQLLGIAREHRYLPADAPRHMTPKVRTSPLSRTGIKP